MKGKVSSGTSLLSQKELHALNQEISAFAYIPLIPTERARPTEKTVEDRGMVIEAAVPIFGSNNSIQGVFYGGILFVKPYMISNTMAENH